MAAARNAEAASSDAALPSPQQGTASPSTAAVAAALVVAFDSAPAPVPAANQSRWFASYLQYIPLFIPSKSLFVFISFTPSGKQ